MSQRDSIERKWVYYVLMWSIPVLFFVLVEGGLRIIGFGEDYPLFVPVEAAPDYLVMNREVAHRYFNQEVRVPTGLHDVFRADRDSTTLRIFVQGGSSAAGYPYYYGGSFSRMLEQRLQQTWPERRVELVNVAMAAINSYTILDQVNEILDQSPDAVLIYAGHNEFYGALGVGSSQSLGRYRQVVNLYLRLQSWRTLQLIRSALSQAVQVVSRNREGSSTLMERMVQRQEIELGSDTYQAGMRQFRGNLRGILGKYQRHGIPVFIGTVASNERTHPPFQSGLMASVDPDQWERAYEEALRSESLPVSIERMRKVVALDSMAAQSWFALGTLTDMQGDYAQARQAYIMAKDLDQLRFRATEEVNQIIREEAAGAGAILVDTQGSLREQANENIIGSDLMLEHLHPNLEGYFVVADAFYDAVYESRIGGQRLNYVPREVARSEVLFTQVDSIFGQLRLQKLLSSWPFQPLDADLDVVPDTMQAASTAEELAHQLDDGELTWFAATERLRAHYVEQGSYHLALKASLALLQEYPYLALPYAYAADVLAAQGRLDEAVDYYGAANDLEESGSIHFRLGVLHQRKRQLELAEEHFERAVFLEPEVPEFQLQLARNHVLRGNWTGASRAVQTLLELDPTHESGLALQRLLDSGSQLQNQ
ncbi:MAG: tetratricopeptide repeat protein [Rhodothermaceae bacterium]|nr:tetratricopeptide repeat protein [Rhodothermaceae bacterium]MXZ57662.1 tetratricopeptide repeat protein [Rhodothermaceae bacterium]MYB91322.1 tetratricopeptide repeat protein [Rhodothermaceae bacterium]MYD68763.1 tetratricopeptide repeat protein [Rhodothermaceae bacterium]MYG45417.1 tetratricopeptide repeat protein [Rhodothermaceae bacterium]